MILLLDRLLLLYLLLGFEKSLLLSFSFKLFGKLALGFLLSLLLFDSKATLFHLISLFFSGLSDLLLFYLLLV